MSYTVERTLTNPVYGVNTSTTHSHNDYGYNEPTYEAAANINQTYSTLNNQPNNNKNKNNTAHLPTVEEHDYHVLESNSHEDVECEVVYSVASEGAGCEGVCSDYEVPRSSKMWSNEDDYSTLKH